MLVGFFLYEGQGLWRRLSGREGSKGSKGAKGSEGSGGRPSRRRGASMIKPNNRPYGRGENKQTGLAPVGNAPLFPLRGTSPGGGSFSGAMLSAAYEMIALRRFYSAP